MTSFLEVHHATIRTMVRLVGSRICRDRGWDIEDLTGDVMVVLAHKQASSGSRFDARRSTLDYYLRMVVRGVIATWLRRARNSVEVDAREEAASLDVPIDEVGVDDAQAALLAAVLGDARIVLAMPCETAYRTLVAWLMADDVEGLARASTLDALDILRYLAKLLARLERTAAHEWRGVWRRHRHAVYRQIRAERTRSDLAPREVLRLPERYRDAPTTSPRGTTARTAPEAARRGGTPPPSKRGRGPA